MDVIEIEGGHRLEGTIQTSGSKNASLPILAAALLMDEPLYLDNVPHLKDVRSMLDLLELLGCDVQGIDGHRLSLTATDERITEAPYDVVRKMRASICVLGPLVAKRGHARVSLPGGCVIGARPVDLHLKGLKALGADVTLDGGYIDVTAPEEGLRGARVDLTGPCGSSVLATANTVMAATLADGETVIEGAAREPEIVDLCACLQAMGAKIEGAGTSTITLSGVKRLGAAKHRVIPDRIEAATLLLAAVATRGKVTVQQCRTDHLRAVLDVFEQMGVLYESAPDEVTVYPIERLRGISSLSTAPYPGFPTDVQAQLMAVLCTCQGHSMMKDAIYPERFLHVAELNRMGASIECHHGEAQIEGVQRLMGADVMSSDLRASAALVIAGLVAEGTTRVHRVYHLDRGYEYLEEKLTQLGASMKRVQEVVSV